MTTPTPPTDPPHLADPRALQILSTEHWSLLTARSLVYNETFTRGGMFLTFLSASLVALGFVYQGSGGGPDFLLVVAVLALDLFVGARDPGPDRQRELEEIRALQAMNRIRHAYLEMVRPSSRTSRRATTTTPSASSSRTDRRRRRHRCGGTSSTA